MRGAVVWPFAVPKLQYQILGYALVAGFNVRSAKVTIFEAMPFFDVAHSIRKNKEGMQAVAAEGLCAFTNRAWSTYYCDTYYYNDRKDTHKRNALKCSRMAEVEPKPHFIKLHWDEKAQADHELLSAIQTRSLYHDDDILDDEIETYAPDCKEADVHPAVKAVRILLCGLAKYPFRKRDADVQSEIIYTQGRDL